MTSEMGEVFNEIKRERRHHRSETLRKNQERLKTETGWIVKNEYYWVKMIDHERVDFYPSSNKYYFRGVWYRGSLPKDLRILIHGQ